MKVKIVVVLGILCLLSLPSVIFFSIKSTIVSRYMPDTVLTFFQSFFQKEEDIIILQKADTFYQQKEFRKALTQYKRLEKTTGKLRSIIFHNMGNTYYRLGEEDQETNKYNTYQLWNYAIEAYQTSLKKQNTDSLNSSQSKKTRENIAFVRNKLEKLKQELLDEGIEDLPPPPPPTPEENGEENPNPPPPSNIPKHQPQSPNSSPPSQKPNQSPSGEQGPDEGNQPPPTPDNEIREFPKADSDKIDESQLLDNAGLSPEKLRDIENHIRDLKSQEDVNIQLNKPSPRTNDTLLDILNDPFFDAINPNESAW